jgi:hypothetical protein
MQRQCENRLDFPPWRFPRKREVPQLGEPVGADGIEPPTAGV